MRIKKKEKKICRNCTRELKGDYIKIGLCDTCYIDEKAKHLKDDPYYGIEPYEV